jgi:hypothetical protein
MIVVALVALFSCLNFIVAVGIRGMWQTTNAAPIAWTIEGA